MQESEIVNCYSAGDIARVARAHQGKGGGSKRKFSHAEVQEIRRVYIERGLTQRELARKFSCGDFLIWKVLYGRGAYRGT